MKKILILFLLTYPLSLCAQKKEKAPKPNIRKAENALREGDLSTAKKIIDVTVAHEKFSGDAKAWYLHGLVYASIDTATNEAAQSLAENPFSIATQSFEKSKKMETPKTAIYFTDERGLPILPEQISALFAQNYFDKGLKYYQDDKEYKGALENVNKALFFIPEDTSVLLNTGLFFAPAAEENEQAITYLRKYLDLGGQSTDAYTMLFSIYRDKLGNNEKALAIAKEAVALHPENADFPKYELDMYIKMDKLEEARDLMEKQVEKNPDDAKIPYYLGVVNQELKDNTAARKWFEKSAELDPSYLDPCVAIAEIVYLEAKDIKKQMNALGISKEDKKKRLELDGTLVEKLKLALPYWETCEKINGEDSKTLDNLLSIYTNLGMDAEMKRIQAKMKSIGIF